jgi:uncharacterized protein
MNSQTRIIAWLALTAVAHSASAAGPPRAQPTTAILRLAQAEPARETAAALRKVITDLQRGAPDAASMEPAIHAALQSPSVAARVARVGALQQIEYVTTQSGTDIYRVTFANGVTVWSIALSPSGRIAGLYFKPVEGPEKAGEDVTVGGLSGTLLKPAGVDRPPVVLLIVGSGPTDRNGNQAGTGPGSLRLLAETLAQRGIASLRYDKRGIGRSVLAGLREQDVVLGSFVDDAAAWLAWLQQRRDLGAPILAGHSEGGLIAILLAKRMPVAGIVLIAAPGRRVGDVLREQLQGSDMPAPLLAEAREMLAALERGETVADVKPELAPLFRPSAQPFMRSLLAVDPAGELAGLKLPVMIVSGGHDLQVTAADAALLAKARPDAARLDVPGMSHVLKIAPPDLAGQRDAYANTSLPLAPGLADAVADFARRVVR